MGYDLHVHTNASDGLLSPETVLQAAKSIGLQGIAITDHDTVDALESAFAWMHQNHGSPAELVPGIELNTDVGPYEVHILGYFINWHDERLLARLKCIKKARNERAEKMVRKINELGMDIKLDQVRTLANGGTLGRPHVAMALMDNGYVWSIKEAFEKYLEKGKPAYVPRYKFEPGEAVQLIKNAGGVAIIAHPGLIGDNILVMRLINELKVDGLEVFYPEHSAEATEYYLNLSLDKGMLITGGSDFHGYEQEGKDHLGLCQVDVDKVESIKKYLNIR